MHALYVLCIIIIFLYSEKKMQSLPQLTKWSQLLARFSGLLILFSTVHTGKLL